MPETEPRLPRRVFAAGLLAAITGGGATALVTLGSITAPDMATFRFARGTTLAAGEAERIRGFLAAALQDDRLKVRIVGHTGTQGDDDANLALSQERADEISAMARSLGIETGRIVAVGVGGGAPTPKSADQSERAHEASLSRADITLQLQR